jgi:hypothetical protein
MTVTREEVLQVVIKVLKDAQYETQEEEEIDIIESTKPIGDIKCFDSLMSVYVTVHCLDSLGISIEDPMKFPTLFIDSKGKALDVGEVVNRILKLLKEK